MSSREEIIKRLHAIAPGWNEVAFGFGRDGKPTIESGGPSVYEGLWTKAEIEEAIEFFQLYLEICPDDVTVAHSDLRLCGNQACEECYACEKSRARHYFFTEAEMNAQKQWGGFVCLVKVGDKFDFCAAGDPRKRVRQLSSSYSEPVELVHSLKSNHQMLSKLQWLRACVDYLVPDSQRFDLPSAVVQLFKSQPEHLIESKSDHDRIMGPVEGALHVPTNLPKLMKLKFYHDTPHEEAIWKALQGGNPLP